MIDFRPDQPKSEQVLTEMRRRIKAGVYKPGHPIPGEPRMAQEFGIARRTARKVINALLDEGLIYTVKNIGTFAADPSTGQPPEQITPEDDTDQDDEPSASSQ
ncbi:winged helix-turn-helix domain-containing protein [Sphaerisporangium sp. NBC_01403]|uniref:GntR family transcriptional regulator n=1 Tax=Sphaerisporangium sp. NBC_01403 TaxID=2903599 RepID=UPI0032512999